jgi:hypothetical protein
VGRAERDGVEPGGERIGNPEGAGSRCEDEKGGLEGVVSIVLVPKHGAADAKHERAMAFDEGLEGGLADGLWGFQEVFEELVVTGGAEGSDGPEQFERLRDAGLMVSVHAGLILGRVRGCAIH